jgi:membrane protein DedA with SNARE-associated domain
MKQLSFLIPYLLADKYLGIFLLNYITSVIVPLPGAAILVVIGTLSHRGYVNPFLSFLVALPATVLGDFSGYMFMRLFGSKERLDRYRRNNRAFELIDKYIHTHPFATIFVSRFVGFTTTAANFASGFVKMPIRTFIVADIVSNSLCVTLYLGIGYAVGSIWSRANILLLTSLAILVFSVFYIVILVMMHLLRSRSRVEHGR